MSNIGQLLHKLTKYQSLYGFVANESKRAVYSQKIAYYKQQLQQAGIDQNNINGVQNLVGGVVYQKEATEITDNILARLAKLARTPESSEEEKKTQGDVDAAILNAEISIKEIKQNYDDTMETVRKIIYDIEEKIKIDGAKPAASVLPDILTKIKTLETQLSELKTHTSKDKFSDNMRTVSPGVPQMTREGIPSGRQGSIKPAKPRSSTSTPPEPASAKKPTKPPESTESTNESKV